MRHRVKKKHFDRTKEQRLALYRSLARALILEERIETSLQRAKAVRPFVERLITLAKKRRPLIQKESPSAAARQEGDKETL
jgi:large subunit ribosomal protein L17